MKTKLISALLIAARAISALALETDSSPAWDPAVGVVIRAPWATVQFDCNDSLPAPVLRLSGVEVALKNPRVTQPGQGQLKLAYKVALPSGNSIVLQRELVLVQRGGETGLVETFQITPEKPITTDLEIERPFALAGSSSAAAVSAVCPLFDGWARPYALAGKRTDFEYMLGNCLGGERLALPVVQLDGAGSWRAAIMSDCRFSSLFSIAASGADVQGSVRYRYAASAVPLKGTETRQFGLWLTAAPLAGEPFGKSVDAFYRLMLPDVPAGPRWLHDIAMVYYDYLSENGQGWEKDVNELARWLKPEECRRVALCFHGWYETLGGYSLDPSTGQMKTEWAAMGRTRNVRLTEAEVKRRLQLARSLGFRVLLYFADGLNQDSQSPVPGCYHADWDYQDATGKRKSGWQGPDTWGKTYARNPAHPDVVTWHSRYLDALLKAYGPVVDGFVWDETFHMRLGDIALAPEPAYCDRAMLDLVHHLRDKVKAVDPEKVFLASDCGRVGYAVIADGTYQDTACKPGAWSYGLFPNWRNTLWSCNWRPVSNFSWTRWGVENFGTPVAISNGYGDDKGPSEYGPTERDALVRLFRERLAMREPVRFLSDNPAKLLASAPTAPGAALAGDPIPTPAPGEANWALAANGATATASSESDYGGGQWGPAGLIDGVRGATSWGHGNGWASDGAQPLPQWVEIAFSQPRFVSRFVVTTYGVPSDPSSTVRWGVKDYDIEIRDESASAWKTVVSERSGRARMIRVHTLEKPVQTSRFRVVIKRIAPADGMARLLELEAWGRPWATAR